MASVTPASTRSDDGGCGIDRAGGREFDDAAGTIELAGVIKWFDIAKGYGFIVPDNGMPDVLLHVSCLRRDGYQVAHEGARVMVEAVRRPRGLHACRMLAMDDSTAVHRVAPVRSHVAADDALEHAQVKWINWLRGFGFVSRGEGTPDIFVHVETLRHCGLTELRPGQTVLVRVGPGAKGLMATEVRPAGAAFPASH